MNRLYILSFLLLACACSNEYDVDSRKADEAVSFHLQGTRATDTQFETGDAISVFASTDNTISYSGNYADNVKYSYVGEKFIAAGEGIVVPETDGVFYHAVYPYSANVTSEFTFSVKQNQSTEAAYTQSDLMMAMTNYATTDKQVPLKFDHVLSKVVIDMSKADLPSGDVVMTLSDVYISAAVNLNDRTFTATGTKGNVTMAYNGTNSVKAILPPQYLAAGTIVGSLYVAGYDYPVTLIDDITLSSGIETTLYMRKYGDDFIFSESPEDERIEQVIPDDIRDEMEPYVPIYDGVTPPNIQNVYLCNPTEVVYCSDNGYEPGKIIDTGIYYRLYSQDFVNNTIDVDALELYLSSNTVASWSYGPGAFVSGSGNNFTCYFNVEGSYESGAATYRQVILVSGTKTATGISNLHFAVAMVEKYDPNDEMMDVGTFRVFKDGDSLSEIASWPSGYQAAPRNRVTGHSDESSMLSK